MRRLKMLGLALVASAPLLAAGAAKADFIPQLTALSGSGSDWTYTYNVNLTSSETGNTGNYFTLYDVNDLISGSETISPGAGWTITEQNLGTTPAFVNFPSGMLSGQDNPSVPNITFQYTGTSTILTNTNFTVTFHSKDNLVANGYFSSEATNSAGTGVDDNIGRVLLPNSAGQTFTPLPKASLGGLALFGFFAAVRAKKVRGPIA